MSGKIRNHTIICAVIAFFILILFYSPVIAQDDEKKTKYFLDKSELAELTDSLQLRQVPVSTVKKMKEDKDYWYADAEIKRKKVEQKDNSYVPVIRRKWFQNLLWAIIITGFVGFVIWWLAGQNVGLFRKKVARIDSLQQDEIDTEDIFNLNYQGEIDKATRQGNYRLAIRLMFLRLLKNLSEKNIIQFSQGKTNFDYLVQLQPTKYYKDFFRITRNYEYSWYGKFEVGEQAYYSIVNDFKNLERQLR